MLATSRNVIRGKQIRSSVLASLHLLLQVALSGQIQLAIAHDTIPAPTVLIEQPAQPATGPGGGSRIFAGILAQHFGPHPDGNAEPIGYWIFEPTRSQTPTASEPLPVVLFLPGFDLADPEVYHVWIHHIVRRGAIVIDPDYQVVNRPFTHANVAETCRSAPPVIAAAVRNALQQLAGPSHAQPDLAKLAVVGHSI